MENEFSYRCRPRSTRPVREMVAAPCGAGSGGGPGDGNQSHHFDGTYGVGANQLMFFAEDHPMASVGPPSPTPPLIGICAVSDTGLLGTVCVRGDESVQITSGLPQLPPAHADGVSGVSVVVGEIQNIILQRGLITGVDQIIQMEPGSIMVDGGAGMVTVQSLSMIKLSVAGGVSSIMLTPGGIIIQGPMVMIN
jgi:hypothetical protein